MRGSQRFVSRVRLVDEGAGGPAAAARLPRASACPTMVHGLDLRAGAEATPQQQPLAECCHICGCEAEGLEARVLTAQRQPQSARKARTARAVCEPGPAAAGRHEGSTDAPAHERAPLPGRRVCGCAPRFVGCLSRSVRGRKGLTRQLACWAGALSKTATAPIETVRMQMMTTGKVCPVLFTTAALCTQ